MSLCRHAVPNYLHLPKPALHWDSHPSPQLPPEGEGLQVSQEGAQPC